MASMLVRDRALFQQPIEKKTHFLFSISKQSVGIFIV